MAGSVGDIGQRSVAANVCLDRGQGRLELRHRDVLQPGVLVEHLGHRVQSSFVAVDEL
jgi:hypothetical protein